MDPIGIISIFSLLGATAGVFLLHRLIGFRVDPGSDEAVPPDVFSAHSSEDTVLRVEELSDQITQLREYLRERDAADDRRWQRLEQYSEEVEGLRSAVRHQRYEVERRLNDSDESRRARERELMQRQERELERHRERELEESEPSLAPLR